MKDINQIFKDYYEHIYNYALKLSCHPDDALDITQETFLKAWQNLASLKQEEAVAGWLRQICYREFLMRIRQQKKFRVVPTDDLAGLEQQGRLLTDTAPLPEDEVVVDEAIRELQNGCFLAMVRKLSLPQRIVFSLVDMFGMPIAEAAEILDVTKGAAKGLLYRARMNIDSFFADHCNLIYEKNPCSCQAWIRFSANRSEMQKQVNNRQPQLDYQAKGYHYNDEVRRRIKHLYSNMTERKPPDQWYQNVIDSLRR